MADDEPLDAEKDYLTLEEAYNLFELVGDERRPEVLASAPKVTLGGGVVRYSRAHLITWAAMGGVAAAKSEHRRGALLRNAMNEFHASTSGGLNSGGGDAER